MQPIRWVLAEDHEDSMEIIKYFINEMPDFQLIGTCTNGDDLVDLVMRLKPDLVLTDINMPKKNGMQAVKECLFFHPALKLIFLTGFDQFAIEAFEISAVDYLVKPIEKERLQWALEKAKTILQFEKGQLAAEDHCIHMLHLKEQNSTQYIPLSDIYFIEKAGKKCLVYTTNEIYETSEPMNKIINRLDDTFYQAHRSNIINLSKITQIMPQNETYVVLFENYDKQASLSKLRINEVRERMQG
ncbi:two-component system LytT family response regulator [Bacillus sp. SORGH_AS 510]|uniref:LytR/AlgR family response regulator transcription factor n=1 Tax=Bacillus sp. SORGH_AS_0510 TaxID=3041771 RepID=UPI002783DF39|nr:LytTR family DNA-binding domain-containing protein [Bacillus sp. SORGH_AS_0510]MDQ1143751.1 two-component system LytT family response regulator [Bacillus sp. SORGH_AS_0510]